MWLRHTVTVEPYEGNSAVGPLYGQPVQVRCFLEEKNRLVRAPDGREVTSSTTFYCRLDAVDAPPESKVTLPGDRQTTVIDQARHDGGGLPLPDHLEVQLI
ncbi:hypothetical protein SAMN04487981_101605 [Streptomyces sp. cf386]|uniref:hypothetical protein n=1 Tax=Streptomyces sp. cf386 TaxID=1761904 RepID=UPI00088C3148|nr:hypothetical protein [Streptomyces sp. cf386]SDM46394.1 hypothetical protein SAMN04487981_101605 [Streptomyces sp. cf386]